MASKKPSGRSAQKAKAATVKANQQLLAVVLFSIGILFGALTIFRGESFWFTLHQTVFGLFGFAGWFIAPLLIYVAIMASLDKLVGSLSGKVWQIALLIVLVSSAIQIFSYGPLESEGLWACITELFQQGILLEGGGLVSGLIAVPFISIFGEIGARILIVLLVFTIVMVFTGGTIIGLLRGATKPVKKISETYSQRMQTREPVSTPRPVRQPQQRPAPIPAAPMENNSPVHLGPRFNVDIPLDDPLPVEDTLKDQETVCAGSAFPNPSYDNDPFVACIPRGSLARQALENPRPTGDMFSETFPSKQTGYEEPEADGLPADPIGVEHVELEDIITGSDTVMRFRTTPAEAVSRPQTTDEVIDEILRQTLSVQDTPPPVDEVERKLAEGIEDVARIREEQIKMPDMKPVQSVPAAASVRQEQPHAWTGASQQVKEAAYTYPPLSLLAEPTRRSDDDSAEELKANAQRLVDTLQSFGVQTRIIDISRGPSVTRYELQPSAGVKISKITSLADDIALNLASAGVRIEAPIPNKPAVGIEVPNRTVSVVQIREIIGSREFAEAKSPLTAAFGRDISGHVAVSDISRMPHVLIAGATGSGKSVCINSIIISLLYKSPPEDVKLLMVDPKVVELGIYNGIPHLLVPVVTDPKKAAGALAWAVNEMLGRYKQFADNSVRDINGFNRLCKTRPDLEMMPQIVIIIDELADLMMAAPNEVEDYICRLAQMARAAGMHLIIATQRPSVDVITGVIKANIPSRIAFAVSSSVDSRTILDSGGAEKLLGRGDMLFYPVGATKPMRVQGCFVTDEEVEKVVDFIKQSNQDQEYDEQIMEEIDRNAISDKKKGASSDEGGGFEEEDEMLPAAIECVVEMGAASTSMLQRKLKLGYARAARIVDQLEEKGIVGPLEGSKPRQVLMSRDQYYEMKMNNEN